MKSGSGVMDKDGATPLKGDGFPLKKTDCIVQCLSAGPDRNINPPGKDGLPTGDDKLLKRTESPGESYTVIGEGYPFSPNGRFNEDFTHTLKTGDYVYCRAWNGANAADAACYGNSELHAIKDDLFDSNDFGTWAVDECGSRI